MAKVTRIKHRWIDRAFEEWEGVEWEHSTIIATYEVEGCDERLLIRSDFPEPITSERQRQEIEPALLRMCDDGAEWAAKHPDEAQNEGARWAAMAEAMGGDK